MNCTCGQIVTQQAKVLCQSHQQEFCCLLCLSKKVSVSYQDLLDQYMGIYDCRECAKKKRRGNVG